MVLAFRANGSAAPGKMGGHRQPILANERDWVLARINPEFWRRTGDIPGISRRYA